jgi:hypothetical protein
MSTDTLTPRDPYRVLLGALAGVPLGEEVTIDLWREQAELAQLTSAERGAAHERAVADGYLVPLGRTLGGRFHTFTIPTTHPAGKGRRVIAYARSGKALPQHAAPEAHGRERAECDGQADLLEIVEAG